MASITDLIDLRRRCIFYFTVCITHIRCSREKRRDKGNEQDLVMGWIEWKIDSTAQRIGHWVINEVNMQWFAHFEDDALRVHCPVAYVS